MAERRLTTHPSPGPANSLWYWRREVGFWKTTRNYACMALARVTPWFRAKNWLYRRMGMRVGRHVSVGLEATMDVFFPELITLHEDVMVGYSTTILAHEFLNREYRTGPVVLERGATVGANCMILPGVVVGAGATVSAMSLVNSDVPAGAFYGGVPAGPLKRRGPNGVPDVSLK